MRLLPARKPRELPPADERALRPFNVAGQVLQPPMGWFSSWFGATAVNPESAGSVPAVTGAVRLVSETLASLPLYVYRGQRAQKRRADNTRQFDLLSVSPNPSATAFDFICDIASHVEWCGNAFVLKVKLDRIVTELWVIDPNVIAVLRDENGDKIFQVREANGDIATYTTNDIIHIRGFAHMGGLVGVSPITMFRDPLGASLAMQQFVGAFFRNDARPGIVLKYPANVTSEQAKEWAELWNAEHAGPRNANRTAVVGGGGDIVQVPINLKDAQFIEARKHDTAQIAQMFRVPVTLLEGGGARTTEQEALNFLNFGLLPRMRRIEHAFRSDTDLFGDSDLYPEFYVDEFLRADAATRAEVLHKLVQAGVLLVDEARADMGLAPLPEGAGQVPQLTPVGGAPNPNPPSASSDEDEDADE